MAFLHKGGLCGSALAIAFHDGDGRTHQQHYNDDIPVCVGPKGRRSTGRVRTKNGLLFGAEELVNVPQEASTPVKHFLHEIIWKRPEVAKMLEVNNVFVLLTDVENNGFSFQAETVSNEEHSPGNHVPLQ